MVDILQITFLSPILHVIFLQFFTVDVSIKLPSNFFLNFVILQLPQLFSVQGGFKLAYSFRNPASYIRANIPDALNLSVTILNLLQIKKIYIYILEIPACPNITSSNIAIVYNTRVLKLKKMQQTSKNVDFSP